MNRCVYAANLNGVEGVLHRLIQTDVAGDDGECLNSHLGVLQRHHNGDGIVAGGVGVDQKAAHQARVPGSTAAQCNGIAVLHQ